MTPKVSIVVPVYNVEKYLNECLSSLKDQTLKDIEILVIDDGSTDSSLEIARKYEKAHFRFKVFTKPNAGYGHSMNMGFKNATGDYIGIVESDDIASVNMFQQLWELATKTNADVVRSNYWTMKGGELTNVINVTDLSGAPYEKSFNPADFTDILRGSPAIWTGLYKREFIADNGIDFLETPGASYQDTGFMLKALTLANRAAITRRAFLHYRIDNENSSVKSGAKVFCVCDEYKSFEELLAKHPTKIDAFKKIVPAKKWETYLWNYNRLDIALRDDFLKQMRKEFKVYEDEDRLDKNFFAVAEWEEVQKLINDKEWKTEQNFTVVPHKISSVKKAFVLATNKLFK